MEGDAATRVRHEFGVPQLLDSGGFLLYEWHTDRRFVLVPSYPLGLPIGGVFPGERFRMRVQLDAGGRVAHVDCSGSKLTQELLAGLGCLEVGQLRVMDLIASRDLASIPELAKSRFWNAALDGSDTMMTLSPDGKLMAASDTDNRTWIVDLDRHAVIGWHDGQRPVFWTLRTVGEPHTAFSEDGATVVVAQNGGAPLALLLREGTRFRPSIGPSLPEFAAVAFTCCPEGLLGLVGDEAVWVRSDGSPEVRSGREGRIAFGVHGARVTRTSAGRPLRLAALDSSLLAPSPRAAFDPSGAATVILDTRNSFARDRAEAGFAVSPDRQLIARNTCKHLEVWSSASLGEGLAGDGPGVLSPRLAMILPLGREPPGHRCHAAVAFNAAGTLIAAADDSSIHVWRVDGRLLGSTGVSAIGHGLHVVAIALDAGDVLTAVLASYRGKVTIARWRLGGLN